MVEDTTLMQRAAVHSRFGPPEVLEIIETSRPVADDDQLLVKVRAASLNRADWYSLSGHPRIARLSMGWFRPRQTRIGIDYSGVVEAVGRNVTGFAPGDEVFGGRDGALAEYVAARFDRGVVHKPGEISHEAAAAVPVAAVTALQALRDHGKVQPGQRILVNGASGGVGVFAIQVAKALGAEVTAVCGPRGVEAARASGAERVVDYTVEDFTRMGTRFDVIVDVSGTRPFRHVRRALDPKGILVIVGAPKTGLFGPVGHLLSTWLSARLQRRRVAFFIAKVNRPDLEVLRLMLISGEIRPVIDRTFRLDEIVEAFRHLGDGHPQGKVIVVP